ncbi:hypothetical protein [Teredinibacter haidensis]|uniref:hypothetical protein n=1 Tax=Teredinibacter haidensis TaxID=2731755 RepID=UPI000948ED00|nr:hypothetical protein [Teredinibacter haidensis]
MKKLVINLFIIIFACTLLFMSYAQFKGIFDWAPWYVNGADVLEVDGKVKSVTWRGGKGRCNCWVVLASSADKVISFYSYKSSYTGGLPKVNGEYSFKYQLNPNQENRPIGIYILKSGLSIYNAELYAGFGLAVTSAVLGTLTFVLSIFLFMVSLGYFKKHITYPE